jgi:hypothetical protein
MPADHVSMVPAVTTELSARPEDMTRLLRLIWTDAAAAPAPARCALMRVILAAQAFPRMTVRGQRR